MAISWLVPATCAKFRRRNECRRMFVIYLRVPRPGAPEALPRCPMRGMPLDAAMPGY